jgi:hypothetical protein
MEPEGRGQEKAPQAPRQAGPGVTVVERAGTKVGKNKITKKAKAKGEIHGE